MAEIDPIESSPSVSSGNNNAAKEITAETIVSAVEEARGDAYVSGGDKKEDVESFFDDEFNFRKNSAAAAKDARELKAENARKIIQKRLVNPINNTGEKVKENTRSVFSRIGGAIAGTINSIMDTLLLNPIKQAQAKFDAMFGEHIARFINITDKIASVVGEREKDVRERLSNTYMNMEEQVYDLMEKIDASFEQKDHNREKQGETPEAPEKEEQKRIDNKLDNFLS